LTLTELLVLVAVLALVFGVLIPYWNLNREKQRRVVCAYRLQQLGVAMAAYASDHDGRLPTVRENLVDGQPVTWDRALVPAYVSHNNLVCPSDRVPRVDHAIPRSYAMFIGTDTPVWRNFIQGSRLPCPWLGNPATTVVLVERAHQENLFGQEQYSFLWKSADVASPHQTGVPQAGNYLFLDGHVEWVDQPTTNMFPAAPDGKLAGRQPCP
jgi:prepilin-type processing-associated H-X9-DG protein